LELCTAPQAILAHARDQDAGGDVATARARVEVAASIVARVTVALMLTKLARSRNHTAVSRPEHTGLDKLNDAVNECGADDRAMIGALYFERQSIHEFARRGGQCVSVANRRHAQLMEHLGARLRGALSVGDPEAAEPSPTRGA